MEYEIAVSYLSQGEVFLETIFHESIARVEYGFKNTPTQERMKQLYHIPLVDMCSICYMPCLLSVSRK